MVGVWAGFPKADFYVARVLCGLLGLVALETLVQLVLEIYRPRVKGKVERPLYESRLVGLLGAAGRADSPPRRRRWITSSGSRFPRPGSTAFRREIAGVRAAAGGGPLLSTCVVFIEPGEQALLERFGRAATGRTVLGPGAHLKWPWPIDQVYRFGTEQIQSFNVGFVPDPARERESTILWTVSHYKEEFNLLVASGDEQASSATNRPAGEQAVPVNLLVVGIPVQYHITNLLAWAYDHASPQALLQQAATREIVRYLAGVDLLNIMSRTAGGPPANCATAFRSGPMS